MRALLINGSPRPKGCTYTALSEVANKLESLGVETELLQLGTKPLADCMACGKCRETGKCVIDDVVNAIGPRLGEFDAFVVGSPVYYSGPTGRVCSFLDRLFYAYSSQGNLQGKLAASVVSCRRGGATESFERLNQFFLMCDMHVVGSQYWNQVHGNTPEQVMEDVEGLQTMRTLAENMAWLLKCIEAGKKAGISAPVHEPKTFTNFIR